MENRIEEILSSAITKIRSAVDTGAVMGKPIPLSWGGSLIPVSRLSTGFLAGGGEYGGKHRELTSNFAGGSGAAVTVTPIAFILDDGEGGIRLIPLTGGETMPKIMESAMSLLTKLRGKK